MTKYLITGGAGFIGSNLSNRLLKENEVVVIDDLSMGYKENLDFCNNLTFIEGSVTDDKLMSDVLSEHKFDYIYHLAAIASVADSVERPKETNEVNFISVLNLLELCRMKQTELKRLIFASSAAVYGNEPTLPKSEESIIRPLTPYAVDKFAAEKYVLAYNNLYGIPTSAVRFFNVYGRNQNPNSPYSGVISILVDRFQKMLDTGESEFTIFGDGEQSRDFVYIEDVIQALLLVAESEVSKGEVYNVGTAVTTTLNTLIETISNILDVTLPVKHNEPRQGDIPNSMADIDKLKTLSYEPLYDIKKGLSGYLSKVIK